MNTALRGVRVTTVVLVLICVVAFSLMVWSSNQESATMDELAHIPSGYAYVRYLDYRLNPEHPPLLKALAGVPLLLGGFDYPTDNKAWTTEVNGQWDMGRAFLYQSGNDANNIIHLARTGPILLTVALIVLIYIFATELIGRRWALLPAALFGLSPNVLAHGHYVTTDVAAAFGITLATYYFVRMLYAPSRRSLALAGAAFGVAQLMKFSAVLLIPYFVLLAVVYGLVQGIRAAQGMGAAGRLRQFVAYTFRHLWRTVALMVIGYVFVVYPIYFLFTVNYPAERQKNDASFVLGSFANGPTPEGKICSPGRCLADLNIWMSDNPVLRPYAEYMLGVLMVLQRSSGGNRNYFMNTVADGGWRSYFPVVYAYKEPLAVVILVLVALLVGVWGVLRATIRYKLRVTSYFSDWLGVNFTEFALLVFVIFYWAWSINSPLNIGFRHLFPTLPFIYILTAGFWKRFVSFAHPRETLSLIGTIWYGIRTVLTTSVKYLTFVFLVAWFLTQTALAGPYYLSYFNELAGGTANGYRIVTDSNYDWGQDLLRLQAFVAARPEIQKIGVDYFGGGDPKYYLGDKEENWWSARGNPATPRPGSGQAPIHYLAVSVNSLQGAVHPVRTMKDDDGSIRPEFVQKPEDTYSWLTALRPLPPGSGTVPEPDYRVGTSIFVYKL